MPYPVAEPGGKCLAPGVAGVAKILVAGPLGGGRTTLVGTVSEIRPLSTEALRTRAGARVDTRGGRTKATTTVALDFGRITLDGELVLRLFGTPGQQRFPPAWRDPAKGALGALALVHTRDPTAPFDALGNPEDLDLPFAVAVNAFPGRPAALRGRSAHRARPAPQHPAGRLRRPGSALIGAGPGRVRTPSRPRRHPIVVTKDTSGRRIRRDHGLRRARSTRRPRGRAVRRHGTLHDRPRSPHDHGALMTREPHDHGVLMTTESS
ncbi:GTP-binding protein [Streptomyces sp. NPDC087659]|uniref:GTP-binding protein n=1 Tax=Streptomyces sp. NPDC087659 TaxID=3365801 RepID=UPI00382E6623